LKIQPFAAQVEYERMAGKLSQRVLWRRAAAGAAAVLVLGAAIYEGPLFVKLSIAASDAYPAGVDEVNGGLKIDDQEDLAQYPASRLALYLRAPSERWRAAVCQALAPHDAAKRPSDWAGVPPLLLHLWLTESNPTLRGYAFDAIRAAPSVSQEDARRMLELLRSCDRNGREDLLGLIVVKSPEGRGLVREEMTEYCRSNDERKKICGFRVLVEYLPEEDEASFQLARTLACVPSADRGVIASLATLLQRRPDFGAKLAAESGDSRQALFRAIARGFELEPERNPPDRRRSVPAKLLSAVASAADDALADPRDESAEAAAAVLRHLPSGGKILARRLGSVRPQLFKPVLASLAAVSDPGWTPAPRGPVELKTLSESLELRTIVRIGNKPASSPFRFESDQADGLMALLPRLDDDNRQALCGYLHFAATHGVFPQGSGPLNRAHAGLMRQYLGSDGQTGALAQWYFENVASLDSASRPRRQ
jgi:hypothetical protein